MPNPTRRDMHVATPLQNLTIAAMNKDDDFILEEACPFMNVDKQTDRYYIYGVGDWNRIEMQPRGPSERSHGAGWSVSNTTYECTREAVHSSYDWSDKAEADDAFDLDTDHSVYLAQQSKLRAEQLFATEIMIAATWTTDFDGASAKAYSSSEVLYWDNASGDPQEDHIYLAGQVKALCGQWPNVMVIGFDVFSALVTNATVRDAIKHTQFTGVKEVAAKLAGYFGVEKLLIAGAFYNSAAEGATDVLGFLVPSDSVWAGFIDPTEGKRIYTACKTFAFKDGGRAVNGVVTRKFDLIEETTTYAECEAFWDVKVIAAAGGYFIDDVLT
jgi:hypothetical protein